MSRASARFREILAGETCTPVAPIFDPLSARVAQVAGWEFCKLSGSVGKAANLGVPDGAQMVTMVDLVDTVRRILRAAEIVLVVDIDDGGGARSTSSGPSRSSRPPGQRRSRWRTESRSD
jgi:oxaloacetate decarboxylase